MSATYADIENLGSRFYSLGGPPRYPRPKAKSWTKIRDLLLVGLTDALRAGRPAPTLDGMCLLLREAKQVAPLHGTTLSRWITDARRAEGLSGGYRAAVAELLPEARRRARILNPAKLG